MRAAPAEDIAFRPVAALAADLARGRLTSVEMIRHLLERIARLDATAKAFITVTATSALAEAEASDSRRAAGQALGPLDGIPFSVKDLIDVAGVKTTAGSRVLADNVAEADSHLVERLRAAGAIPLGKANLHEFAYGATGENPVTGTAVNAYDTSRLAGGSSSGSAAGVAFGLVPASIGTDTGGSVRAPAALSGLVGLKPTLGRISTRGVIPYSWTLDHIGLMTRTVADAALLLQATAGWDTDDPASAKEPVPDYSAGLGDGIAGLTIGVPREFYFERCAPDILAAAERMLEALKKAGAVIKEVALPSMDKARTVSLTLQMPESLSFHAPYLEARGDLYGEDFRAGLALGQCLLAEHYVRARRMVEHYRQATDAVFDDVDLLLTPAAPVTAPRVGESHVTIAGKRESLGNAITRYTTFFNMSGHPAVTLPSGLDAAGLPMGVQLIARHFEEPLLLRAAAAAEAASTPLPMPEAAA